MQSRAEQSRAEQSRAEQSRAEQHLKTSYSKNLINNCDNHYNKGTNRGFWSDMRVSGQGFC